MRKPRFQAGAFVFCIIKLDVLPFSGEMFHLDRNDDG